MSFRVPNSTSPPSTPEYSRKPKLAPHPSTTPAGPPPSSLTGFSTTPAGNPPASSFFGHGSNGSAVPFPTFGLLNRINPLESSYVQEEQSYGATYQNDDAMEDDPDAMDEGDGPNADLNALSQASREDLIPYTQTLNLQEIAKGLEGPKSQTLKEDATVVLGTEKILEDLSRAMRENGSNKDHLLSFATTALLDLWKRQYPIEAENEGIGPDTADPAPPRALFIASLLLRLHHPLRKALGRSSADPTPKVLLDWLQVNHWPFRGDLYEVQNFKPNCASHDRYWDIIYNTTARGNLRAACELLRSADLSHAATAIDDGASEYGYSGGHLENGRKVMARAVQIVQLCPGLVSEDWNVTGGEWIMFRRRVRQADADLESFAEGTNAERYADEDTNFEAPNFGLSTPSRNPSSMSQRSRQAESRVPWSIYQNLKYFYGQLLGTTSELIAASNDWVEALVGIVAWWSGSEDGEDPEEEMGRSARLARSFQRDRLVDTHPTLAYFRKLSTALEDLQTNPETAEDTALQIDPTDAIQVALGCAFVGEIEGLIRLVRHWSPTIASAIVEIADMGGWLGRARPSEDMMDGFSQSDLMVLSYAKQPGHVSDYDTMLGEYAGLLATQQSFSDGNVQKPGWQLAVEVLGRLRNTEVAASKIADMLDNLEIKDSHQVEQTVSLCNRMGLHEQARKISEVSPSFTCQYL